MIYWFSGTGNSAVVAESLASRLSRRMIPIPLASDTFTGDDLGIVCPVYSWGIPPIVLDFIKKLKITGKVSYSWVVLTCGDEVAKAPEMIIKALKNKGIDKIGVFSVIMPNNYVLLPGFNIDSPEVEAKKLEASGDKILKIADKIIQRKCKISVTRGSWPNLKTKLIYPLFKKFGISAKKWHWQDQCINCNKCAKACPVENIRIIDGHPHWNNNCTSCLACYHVCPVHAVAYGKETLKKGQYVNPTYSRRTGL